MNDLSKVNEGLHEDDTAIQCFVYKGALKDDHFLFLPCALEALEYESDDTETSRSDDPVQAATQQALMDAELDAPAKVKSYRTLPDQLLDILGELRFVTEFSLHKDRYLQQSDPVKVLSVIQQQGFYLQVPKTSNSELEELYFGSNSTTNATAATASNATAATASNATAATASNATAATTSNATAATAAKAR